MGRIAAVRIVRWPYKLLYAVGAWAIVFLVGLLLRSAGSSAVLVAIVSGVLALCAFLVGARIFRGAGEDIAAPRAWWRMTSRPTLSRRLGVLFVVLAILGIVDIAIGAVRPLRSGLDSASLPSIGAELAGLVVLAFLYLNSASRLRILYPSLPPVAADPSAVVSVGAIVSPDVSVEETRVSDVNHALRTSRHRVDGFSTASAQNPDGRAARGVWRVFVDRSSGDAIVHLYRGDRWMGSLTPSDSAAYAPALDQLGGPLVVSGLVTGDRLWVELPDVDDLRSLAAT